MMKEYSTQKLITNAIKSIMKALVVFTLFTISTLASAQDCTAELSVDNGITVETVTKKFGATYFLTLKNTGSKTTVYSLSAKALKESCDPHNTSETAKAENVTLKLDFLNENGGAIETIELQAGQYAKVTVKVSVPSGTTEDRWSCMEVLATAKGCEVAANQLLQMYYPPQILD